MFNILRSSILKCAECSFKDPLHEPIYFNFDNPDNIKILILTEQPNITPKEIEKAIKGEIKSDMILFLQELFNDFLNDLIINHTGIIYWSHQTKCYSSKREVKPECSNKWIIQEIELFKNLKIILTLGSYAFQAIPNNLQMSFPEYLWKEINMITNRSRDINQLQYDINGKKILCYCIPHPSKKNPLSIFNDHFINYFKNIMEYVL